MASTTNQKNIFSTLVEKEHTITAGSEAGSEAESTYYNAGNKFEENYPSINSHTLTRSEQRSIHETNRGMDEKKNLRIGENAELDPRSAAFANMANTETIAMSLTCTKACRNVTTLTNEGESGQMYSRTLYICPLSRGTVTA